MLRSLAPTSLRKKALNGGVLDTDSKRKTRNSNENANDYLNITLMSYEEQWKILTRPFKHVIPNYVGCYTMKTLGMGKSKPRRSMYNPNMPNALVLYRPPEIPVEVAIKDQAKVLVHVVVDPELSDILRPHQRIGVEFMYKCVTGAQIDNYYGCIMADDMGLGKTLQCITLLWTLLKQGPECKPTIEKAIIVCPSSLVKNWGNEITKWLKGRLPSVSMDGGADAKQRLENFLSHGSTGSPVLIISYETFRLHSAALHKREIGIVFCDEGHRLKNCENQTYQALMGLNCKRRVLLSGTPIQNDLTEYYSLINFVNQGLLGTAQEFRRKYENIIMKGQNADATDDQCKKAAQIRAELFNLVNKCLIRRTNAILTKYLPVKHEMIICCKLSSVQKEIYEKYISSELIRRQVQESDSSKPSVSTLASITTLKKLVNHPDLVLDKIQSRTDGFEKCGNILPPSEGKNDVRPYLSGKLMLLDMLLATLKANYNDKIVLVSNYTQTLDLFERLCRKRCYLYVRLDGTMTIKKRGKVVEKFNIPETQEWIFMLSSKAGGCGLNLIGANRLVMFDPDWNPANDDQAMARVWRDGQQKPCYVYRFLATGTIEEKIFQRQTHKKALSSSVVDNSEDTLRHFTADDLRELFKLENSESDTHRKLKCKRCCSNFQSSLPPEDADCSSDLAEWHHAWNRQHLADMALKKIWDVHKGISFCFHQKTSNAVLKPTKVIKDDEEDDYVPENEDEDDDYMP